jgi:hypothetical protein
VDVSRGFTDSETLLLPFFWTPEYVSLLRIYPNGSLYQSKSTSVLLRIFDIKYVNSQHDIFIDHQGLVCFLIDKKTYAVKNK